METAKFGRRVENGATHPFGSLELCFRSIKRADSQLILILLLLISPLYGQQSSQVPPLGSTQNPNQTDQNRTSVDCTDPEQASAPECIDQTLSGSRLQNLQQRPDQSSQRGNPNSQPNYEDTETFSRQDRNAPNQNRLPAEPLTEFQKFMASSTGQVLPIFGSNLFRRVPSTFAPLEMTPVPSDYLIGPGDELRIRVWGQISFQANVRVDRSGEIYVPQVGPIHVANIPFSALEGQLRSGIGRVYHNFDLTVDLGQIRSIQVYLAGEARRPGVYTVSSLSTLVDALFAGGGPSTQGSLRSIELRRGSETITKFDLYNLLAHGDKSKDVKLLSGDVIFIPPVGAQVAVIGSVKVPAIYEVLPGESLGQVLANAGGVSAVASGARVSIERTEDHRTRRAMEVAYDESGLRSPIVDGDLVRVFSIVPRYTDTVTLRGNTSNPGRFAWHPGMRISDLIPDKDSLVTRDYWWKRSQLGLPAPDFEPAPEMKNMRQPVDNNVITLSRPTPDNPNSQQGSQELSSQDQSLQDQSLQDQSFASQSPRVQDRSRVSQQRAANSSLAEQQDTSASRMRRNKQGTNVRLLAPDIDWNYATIERIDSGTLKTTLIPFDLGKVVLLHDASQDLELRSGDIVSIFSEADIRVPLAQQTKLVTLDGEFLHSGVYTAQPGETLRQLVIRAGGITDKAYLYGSEFSRESTRASQQARLDEYVRNLEMSIHRSNLANAASTSSPQDAATSTAAQATEREMVYSLRQIKATGRIVLQFKPEDQALAVIPNIELENGDRFVIPSVPATINVVGAVYNQNSFLYFNGRFLGKYLSQAGGPNRDADSRHEFVIRANGDVVSRDKKGVWDNNFARLRMDPGDSIVVPSKTYKPSALKGLLELTSLFSQLALGIAAINVIQ
jgi:protein involved in polysaccharide export with SLBB domain